MSDTIKKALAILEGGDVFLCSDPPARSAEELRENLEAIFKLGGEPDFIPLLEVQKLPAAEVPYEDFLKLVRHMGPGILSSPLGQEQLGRLWSEKIDGSKRARKGLKKIGLALAWVGNAKGRKMHPAQMVMEVRREQEQEKARTEERLQGEAPLEVALERVADRHKKYSVEYLRKILKRSQVVKVGDRIVYVVK